MNFSDKCNVLGDLWLYYREEAKENEAWSDFFRYNDVALPMAYGINEGYVTLVEDSGLEDYIDETWEMFCDFISIDSDGEYDGLNDAWQASPNPPLSEDSEPEEVEKPKRTRKKAEPPSS